MTRASRNSHRSSNEVIAATAGLDNWKTWAGRAQGNDNFQVLDLFRGVKRKFNKKFVWKVPDEGTPCPVCYVEPDCPEEWHITSACGHAVCIDCFQGYAASQVRDSQYHGPLKCPICPLPLREKDAIAALQNDTETIQKWDVKIRDEVLRALPGYRQCPRCDDATAMKKSDGEAHNLAGGGFVTPACLGPINDDRERRAKQLLALIPISNGLSVGVYGAYLYTYTQLHSTSIFVDILNSFAPLLLMRRLWLMGHLFVARRARQALFKPITVECPCCDKAFILNAEAELSNVLPDDATQKWIVSNCRPCPSCSAPISKIEGCNHMRCTHCRAQFCWACMRLRSICAAYKCSNGAPYGNATIDDGIIGRGDNGGGMIAQITNIEAKSTQLDIKEMTGFMVVILAIAARESQPVQIMARVAVTSFAFCFSGGFLMAAVMMYALVSVFKLATMQRLNYPVQGGQIEQPAAVSEEEILANAIALSLLER